MPTALRWVAFATAGLLAVIATASTDSPAQAAPVIEWRVENPFRLFTDPKLTDMHRRALAALPSGDKDRPIQASERVLAAKMPDGWARQAIRSLCWSSKAYRHVCPDATPYIEPKSHAVVAHLTGMAPTDPEDTIGLEETVSCRWRVGNVTSSDVVKPCSEPARLPVPYPDGAKITVFVENHAVVSRHVRVTDLLVVGIGDSFASGEGNPDVAVRFAPQRHMDYGDGGKRPELAGYPARVGGWRSIGDRQFIANDAQWLDRACHRSLYSHQLRAALQLSLADPHRAVTYVGFACSGAETTFGLFLYYRGHEWVPEPPDQPQISAVAREQCGSRAAQSKDLPDAYHLRGKIPELQQITLLDCDRRRARKIDLLFVSIGGNDIGFARLVANAVIRDRSVLRRLGGWFGHVHDATRAIEQLAQLRDRYKALNRAIHNIFHVPWNESDRVILTAYPPLALQADGRSVCADGRPGMDVLADFELSSERTREGMRSADLLNTAMREEAKNFGWSFAEAHRDRFAGHGICAIAPLEPGADLPVYEETHLPRWNGTGWRPFDPDRWMPYAGRTRWFRTPNDAFLTGNFHVGQNVLQSVLSMQSLSWMQLLLASTYSGAFHPTAEGQAVIADAVAAKADHVLERFTAKRRQ